jgi:hypothetical protein
MFELTFGFVVGTCVGYGVRAFISHYRHLSTRRRLGMT